MIFLHLNQSLLRGVRMFMIKRYTVTTMFTCMSVLAGGLHNQTSHPPTHTTDPRLNVRQAVITLIVFKGLSFTASPSIVNVLYSIWQDGRWLDTEVYCELGLPCRSACFSVI